MRKLLMSIAAVTGFSLGMAQAAEVSVVNPSVPVQPQPLVRPVTPALTPAFNQQPSSGLAPGQIAVHAEMRENIYGVTGWSSTQNGPRR